MKLILNKAKKHLAQQLPFVLYKKPNESTVFGLFQKGNSLFSIENFSEKGFIFTSFDGFQKIIIPENQSECISATFAKEVSETTDIKDYKSDPNAKIPFERLVKKTIVAIENQEFKKAVVSRREDLQLVDFDLIATFQKLVQFYPSTFVYSFYHPKVGCWLGATPEQLVRVKDNTFLTMALAGTQKDMGINNIVWQKKEQEEQQFVTDFIAEKIKDISSDITISKPYSIKAGSIWHIKTDLSGVLNSNSCLQQIVSILHPTPAVCGLPTEQSKTFLLQNENYDRSFYTGYLGELNRNNQTDLFVNLRCMEIENTQAHLFLGCGITKDSNPEKEWEESVNKSVTMKKVLNLKI
jgi:isochorismate synthase